MPKKRRGNKQFEARQIQLLRWRFEQVRLTATAVVHHLAPALRKALPALGYRHLSAGIFRCNSVFPTYLISLEDLPDELVPEELQVFSNSTRRERVFLSCFGRKNKKLLMEAMLELYESEVKKLMALYNIKQKSMRKYVEALGKEKVIAAIRKDELLAALSKKDMIAAMGGKKRLIKSLLVDLAPAERQKLLAQLNGNGASPRQSSKSKAA